MILYANILICELIVLHACDILLDDGLHLALHEGELRELVFLAQ